MFTTAWRITPSGLRASRSRNLLRYYLIATCIVLTVAVLATAWSNRDRIRATVSSQQSRPQRFEPASTPHGGFQAQGGTGNGHLQGDAPWALSALPECLIQRSEATGTLAYVRSKLPHGATAVAPGTVLRYGSCTISVRDGEALVSRGNDRLRIPPHVTLYRAGNVLALLRDTGARGELRIYTTSAL
jgi:hypothetical protein